MIKAIERAIAAISPEWACRRAAYSEYLRAYEAGEVNRFNDGWTPINADTENTDKTQRDLIKARARYLEGNSDIAEAAVGGIVRNVVGVGIKPQARTDDEGLNRKLETLWKEWTEAGNCDITAQQTIYELERMVLRRKIYDGEIIIKKVIDTSAEFPLKLQVIKTDLLDNYLLTAPESSNVIRSGIELNEYLRPLAYWIKKKSPDGYIEYEPDRVPADQVIHLWTKKYPDQIRGMSDLLPVIKRMKDTQEYLDAETVAAKIAACFSVFITQNSPTPGPGRIGNAKDPEGKKLTSIRPGMIKYLRPGESVEMANPSRSITSAKDFVGVQQRLAGAGMGLSYEIMSRDFEHASFSAARQGALEDRKTFEPVQVFMVEHFCRPVYADFVDMCVLTGRVKIRDYWQNRRKYTAADWIAPGWSWIDPVKEVTADIQAIQNGGKTLAQWCAERGYDWREQLEQMALEKKTAEELGLKLAVHTPISVQAAESNHVVAEESDEEGKDTEKEDGTENEQQQE